MNSTHWRVVIADAPHREDLFAEIWIDDEQFGEVFLKDDKPVIEVYAHRVNADWRFQYDILQDILMKTDDFLKSMGYSRA
jgi:hypothetical protein